MIKLEWQNVIFMTLWFLFKKKPSPFNHIMPTFAYDAYTNMTDITPTCSQWSNVFCYHLKSNLTWVTEYISTQFLHFFWNFKYGSSIVLQKVDVFIYLPSCFIFNNIILYKYWVINEILIFLLLLIKSVVLPPFYQQSKYNKK